MFNAAILVEDLMGVLVPLPETCTVVVLEAAVVGEVVVVVVVVVEGVGSGVLRSGILKT